MKKRRNKDDYENPANINIPNPEGTDKALNPPVYENFPPANPDNVIPEIVGLNNSITFITFRPNLIYNGDTLCHIDLLAIEDGQEIALFNACKHIYHTKCIRDWHSKRNNNEECFNCNARNNNPHQNGNQI